MLHLLLRFQSEASVRIQWVGFFHLRNPWLWTLKTFPETLNQKVVRSKCKSNAFVVCSKQPQQTPFKPILPLAVWVYWCFYFKECFRKNLKDGLWTRSDTKQCSFTIAGFKKHQNFAVNWQKACAASSFRFSFHKWKSAMQQTATVQVEQQSLVQQKVTSLFMLSSNKINYACHQRETFLPLLLHTRPRHRIAVASKYPMPLMPKRKVEK